MKSELEKVAEAVLNELAVHPFSIQFTPTRTYNPNLKLEDADTLRVDVVPVRSDPERQDRATIKWLTSIDIGVRFRFDAQHQDADTGEIETRHVDRFFKLEQEILRFFFQHDRLTNYDDAVLTLDPDLRVAWIPKHMAEWRQFTGIIRVTYQSETDIDD